ncbi:DUF2850 domain-containing protein [Photobacterium lipolyticum]|uniref:DUF2850 domain-containing protein n=1 Tax=Photobacterium lipolyticum TaxID=266810 RepID=A0A2T3MT35_9GAMM|nr:DUF2850 domain-containing protein [Photobacterium lipolyticum]PSW01721.1 hypothetical protein C9I89_19470 [Photobacterium lipolyticum]
MKKVRLQTLQSVCLVLLSSTALIFSASLALGLVKADLFEPEPVTHIYGTWVEQEVAPYVADSFEIRPAGVFIHGRQVSTHFEWDGSTLKYRLGDEIYLYTYLSEKLVRQKPAHYISTFSR